MKKILSLLLATLLFCGSLSAQEQRIIFYQGANPIHTQMIENVDSVCFVNNISIVHNNLGTSNFQYPVVGIDSIVFSTQEVVVDTGEIIYITYNGNNVSVINPWSNRGVTVTCNGANVTVNAASGYQDIAYCLSGSTSAGSLVIRSDHRLNLIMRGVSITNPTGAAIKVIDDVKISATLENNSTLVDGNSSPDKAAFDSEGQIVFSGNGTLNVTGNVKHGIFSNDYIRVLSGNIKVNSAVTDGLHADYFQMFTGSIDIDNAKTGIDGDRGFIEISGGSIDIDVPIADGKGIKCDSTFVMSGGSVNLTLSGGQSKGIKAGKGITLDGGDITINGSGATVVTDNDPSHCAGLKSDANVTINGGTLEVTMSSAAAGGKGINADGNVYFNGGTVTLSVAGAGGTYTNTSNQSDSYSASCVKCNGNLEVGSTAGNTDITLSASGNGSKGFSADGNITMNGGTVTATVGGTDGRGFTSDQSITINDGSINMTLTGNVSKGLKSDLSMLVAGGALTINANGSTVLTNNDPAYCTGIKADGSMNVTGGTMNITCGSSNTGGRCISVDGVLSIAGGDMTLKTQGSGTTYTNSSNSTDAYGPMCVKVGGNLLVTAGVINCESTGNGGRGIKVEGTCVIGTEGSTDHDLIDIDIFTSGAPLGSTGGGGGGGWPPGGGGSTNYCKAKGLKVLGDITIHSGHLSVYCSQTSGDPTAEAIETKSAFHMTGGFVEANSYDDAINSQTGFTMSGGYLWAYARGNDGIDNNGTSTAQATNLTGGVIIAAGTEEAIDANIDRGGSFYINGATIIGFYSGNSGMGVFDNPTYQNGQKRLQPTLTAGQTYCIKNSNGDDVMIYNHQKTVSGSGFMSDTGGLRPPGGGGGSSTSFIFTSPQVTTGTYTLYSNPTISGTDNWHGLYIGASATASGSGTSVTAQ